MIQEKGDFILHINIETLLFQIQKLKNWSHVYVYDYSDYVYDFMMPAWLPNLNIYMKAFYKKIETSNSKT